MKAVTVTPDPVTVSVTGVSATGGVGSLVGNEPWRFKPETRLEHLEWKLHRKKVEISWLLQQNKNLKERIRNLYIQSVLTVVLVVSIAAAICFRVN